MSDERLCGICGETPVGAGHHACPDCVRQATWISQNDPYWWMEPGATKPQPAE